MYRQPSASSIPRRSRSVTRARGAFEGKSIQSQLSIVENGTFKMNRPSNISRLSGSVSRPGSVATQQSMLRTPIEPKRLFRSNSNLALSARSNSSTSIKNKISTPHERLICKSPHQLKQLYSHLDESENVARIIDFVAKKGESFEVVKPLKISAFIGVTQLLLSELSNGVELTMKNYKTEIPLLMKSLKYPIAITQNLMKSPNTSQNFTPVLSIWTFLMDLVDASTGESDGVNIMSELMCKYMCGITYGENVKDLRSLMLDSIYQHYGYTTESFTQVLKECELDEQLLYDEEIRMHEKEEEQQLSIDKNNEYLKHMQTKTDETLKRIAQIDKDMQDVTGQIECSKTTIEFYQKLIHDNESKLKIIKQKAAEVGHAPDEDEPVSRELQYKSHHLQLLQKRYDEYKEARRFTEDHVAELRGQALEYMFSYNSIIRKSKLLENRMKMFLLDETEINNVQIEQMAVTIEDFGKQLEKESAFFREALDGATRKLVDAETQLANATMATEDAYNEIVTMQEKQAQMMSEHDNTMKEMEEEVRKITRLEEIHKMAKEKLEKTQKAALKNKAILQKVTEEIRHTMETRKKIVLEKHEARAKRLANVAHQLNDIVEETKENINAVMIKNNHPKLF